MTEVYLTVLPALSWPLYRRINSPMDAPEGEISLNVNITAALLFVHFVYIFSGNVCCYFLFTS